MSKRSLTLAMALLFMAVVFHMPAAAQIDKVTMHLDAFLCDSVCVNVIGRALTTFSAEIEDQSIDYKTKTLTIFPNPEKSLDVYDIRQELGNAERPPWRIEIVLTGEVVDYTKTYSGGMVRPRKALKVKKTGQRFILKEGKQRDMLLDAVKAGREVTVFGEIPAFIEKNLPLLVIKEFTVAKEKK